MKTSVDFRAQASKAVAAILLFIFSYIVLFVLALGLTVLCVFGGIMLIITFPRLITIVLGIGLASVGFLILIFLIKFLFKSHKVDRSHLLEIKEQEQPGLFALIDEVVRQVGTNFPKKVYLSADVNASVFYDSSFWSMFLPIKKNLQIGMGLVNSVNQSEFKAILAHEFGHFSQRSMKVGSYVYNVNQVIHNMLYENDSYDRMVTRWAEASGYFTLFAVIAMKIVAGIQWILKQLYGLVNKSYMALSREMEFQADEIAAQVTGYEPLQDALLRLPLANQSFSEVLAFYEDQLAEQVKSENLYPEHAFVLEHLARNNQLPFSGELPMITLEEFSKFNKSKLEIKDQWASHPSTRDRVLRLRQTGLQATEVLQSKAISSFQNLEQWQNRLTDKIFSAVEGTDKMASMALINFQEAYVARFQQNQFPALFNNYYDSKDPMFFDVEAVPAVFPKGELKDLYSEEQVEKVYELIALDNDMASLENIKKGLLPVKSFDYDGQKYRRKEANKLLPQLQQKKKDLLQEIKANDEAIFYFFRQREQTRGGQEQLIAYYQAFFEAAHAFAKDYPLYLDLSEALQFIQYTLPIEQIKENFRRIEPMEAALKQKMEGLLANARYAPLLSSEIKKDLEHYRSKTWTYFGNQKYFDNQLQVFFTALNHYAYLLSQGLFLSKKSLLNYQASLVANQ